MRDRLIELLKGAETKVTEMLSSPLALEEWLGIYADYLLENGVIVPPCKVGDTVYEFYEVRGNRGIAEHIVTNVAVGLNPREFIVYTKHKQNEGIKDVFYGESFCETVFLTREEAERALKGGGEE